MRWPALEPFQAIDMRPGRIVTIGAAPKKAKTTLIVQLVSGIIENSPDLRCVIGNVEVEKDELMLKVLSRLSGVSIQAIRDAEMTPSQCKRVDAMCDAAIGIAERIEILKPPFTVQHMADAMTKYRAKLAVVDYVQRFNTGAEDGRIRLNNIMTQLRTLALAGAGIFVVSSVSRQKDTSGKSGYDGLTQASLNGSSELEFATNDVYLMENDRGVASLICAARRAGPHESIYLRFQGDTQTFTRGEELDDYATAPETPADTPKGRRRKL